jgi:hypothetical protein
LKALLLLVLALAACSTPASRIKKHRDVFDAASPEVQEKIKNGEADLGMTQDQVRVALGAPERQYERKQAGVPDQEVWVYDVRRAHSGMGVGIGVFSGGGPVATGVSVGTGHGYEEEPGTQVVFENGKVVRVERRK